MKLVLLGGRLVRLEKSTTVLYKATGERLVEIGRSPAYSLKGKHRCVRGVSIALHKVRAIALVDREKSMSTVKCISTKHQR